MNAHAQPQPVRTTCPYCGVGCGLLTRVEPDGDVAISGDPEHPANFGRICSKGAALGETLGLQSRLLHPMLRQADGSLAQVDWPMALTAVADGFRRVLERHGPEAVAFYLSGQLLTEDYYVANKLMKGFIGSANVDTNSRLCMASAVAGHRRAFGADTVPGVYADLDQADLLVLVGSNTAWCHPVLFQRMLQNKRERGASIVVIDPRRTATAEEADLFLPIRPGTDAVLFSGLLSHIADASALDDAYIHAHTGGFAAALRRAREIAPDAATTAARSGLPQADVVRFFEAFAATPQVVTCFSQGINQSAQGTDKVNAIINCHLATGRIGKPGAGPFSLTGQPNAMGGREVGGLANQLAAHMGFTPEDVSRVRRFWRAPRMAVKEGLKAVAMFEAIEAGKIKALWVMGSNPAVSLPRAGAMRGALRKVDVFVVSENVRRNDTVTAGAHVLLPAAAWGERDGTVTNSERRISRQRAFLALPGEAQPDWWIVSRVAQRMGFREAFDYGSAAQIFREHAALSVFENNGRRDFDLAGLARLTDDEFNALAPVQWPVRTRGEKGETRFFAAGRFFTADAKARFVAVAQPSQAPGSAAFPLRLNTGRIRDQWHTMTRTGLSPRLASHQCEPFVEINAQDARAFGITAGDFVRVATEHGACVVKAAISDGQQPGSLFAPIHWSAETASCARVGELVGPRVDPISGQPECKNTPASIARVAYPYRGFAVSRAPLTLPPGTWWTRITVAGAVATLFATTEEPAAWRAYAPVLFELGEAGEYVDAPRDIYRVAAFEAGRLTGCLFVGPAKDPPQWDAVAGLFATETLDDGQRRVLLSGKHADGLGCAGPTVCACFGVGLATLRAAIASGVATSVEAIGKALRAGTNCGSCLPELKRIVSDGRVPASV
jgi:assimilatory nitrate reductase catalytic subunit